MNIYACKFTDCGKAPGCVFLSLPKGEQARGERRANHLQSACRHQSHSCREVRESRPRVLRTGTALNAQVGVGVWGSPPRTASVSCMWMGNVYIHVHALFYRAHLEPLVAADEPRLDKAYCRVPATKCTEYIHT
jgi:hypothetical protein